MCVARAMRNFFLTVYRVASLMKRFYIYTYTSMYPPDWWREKEKNRLLKNRKKWNVVIKARYGICLLCSAPFFHHRPLLPFHSLYCCWLFLFFSSIYPLIYNLDSLIVIGFCGLVCNRLCVNIWESLSPFRFDTIASSDWLPLYFPISMLWRAITEPETWNIRNI